MIGSMIASQFGDAQNWPLGSAMAVMMIGIRSLELMTISGICYPRNIEIFSDSTWPNRLSTIRTMANTNVASAAASPMIRSVLNWAKALGIAGILLLGCSVIVMTGIFVYTQLETAKAQKKIRKDAEAGIEAGREAFDFLRGDEGYKYQLGGVDSPIYQLVIRRG